MRGIMVLMNTTNFEKDSLIYHKYFFSQGYLKLWMNLVSHIAVPLINLVYKKIFFLKSCDIVIRLFNPQNEVFQGKEKN